MASKIPHFEDYPFKITPLSDDEGGGYLITFPDLPGCMSDGDTLKEAMEMGRDAFASWMAVHLEEGREIPEPFKNAELVQNLINKRPAQQDDSN